MDLWRKRTQPLPPPVFSVFFHDSLHSVREETLLLIMCGATMTDDLLRAQKMCFGLQRFLFSCTAARQLFLASKVTMQGEALTTIP
jgi:hypothetical protein